MVTGGFRTRAFCDRALEGGDLDVVGFARPYLLHEDFPSSFLSGQEVVEKPLQVATPAFQDMVEGGWYDYQIWRLANGKGLNPDYSPASAILRLTWDEFRKGLSNRLG
jgi:hypothetical protein